MAIDDLAIRRYDVAAFRGAHASGDTRLDPSLLDADSGGEAVVGVAKLAQWFLVELMTARGSVPHAPSRGTTFFPELHRGRLRSEADVFAAFGFAVGDLQAAARLTESPSDPADERFADAELLAVAILPGYARLTISIRSRAGSTRQAILPVSTLT